MITIITGSFGSGKTGILREKLFLEIPKRSECYYLGFDLDSRYSHTLPTENSLETIPKRFETFSSKLIKVKLDSNKQELLNYLEEIYKYCKDKETPEHPLELLPNPPAVFIDESYILFDTRGHSLKSNRALLFYMTQLSLRGVDFYLSTHELSRLDKRLRENFDNLIETSVEYLGQKYEDIKIKITETRITRLYNVGSFNKIAGIIK